MHDMHQSYMMDMIFIPCLPRIHVLFLVDVVRLGFPVLVSLTLVLCLPQVFTDAGQYTISFGSVGNSWSFIDPEDVSVPMR
jgi:hypothetical protein